MGNTFFIADTHFHHQNIIGYENRPFNDVDEMTETMVENWNKVVRRDDRVFVLGDFVFHPSANLDNITKRLRGNKVLVMGNHDSASISTYIKAGFKEVYRYPIIYKGFWMLSHEPLYINSNMPYANIFGHVHSNPAYSDCKAQTFCASVEREHVNYTPINYEEVRKLMGE